MTINQFDTKDISQAEREWAEVEQLVMTYQMQFSPAAPPNSKQMSKDAAEELLERFKPLFKKYCTLIKTGNINYADKEMKNFVTSFIEDNELKKALKRPKQNAVFKKDINSKFKFVVETYGLLPDEDIMLDLQMIFLIIAKRYKQMGRSFCGYIYNAYRFEVSRHIKKYIKNPVNIPYKMVEYTDYINNSEASYYEDEYETQLDIPDLKWINGEDCSQAFKSLSHIERLILVKYYLDEWNDRQMSEHFGIHINTVNQKRRAAVKKIAQYSNHKESDIKRNRRSGKKAYIPDII